MARSNKGKKVDKTPKQRTPKSSRNNEKKARENEGMAVYHDGKEADREKHYRQPTAVESATVNEIHDLLNESYPDFKKILHILKDPNIDFEEKKFMIVTQKDEHGKTTAQVAIERNAPVELIELLIFIGGSQVVTAQDTEGYNCIHTAANRGVCPEIVHQLCYIGRDTGAVTQTDHDNQDLPLHKAVRRGKFSSLEVVKTLIQYGGRDSLKMPNFEKMLPVHSSLCFMTNEEITIYLLTEGIHHGVGGDEAIGGLLVKSQFNEGEWRTTMMRLKEKGIDEAVLTEVSKVKNERNKRTSLHSAIAAGDTSAAEEFIKIAQSVDPHELIDETRVDPSTGLPIVAMAAAYLDLSTIYFLIRREPRVFGCLATDS